jgi:Tfp pilus assembly protein PilE
MDETEIEIDIKEKIEEVEEQRDRNLLWTSYLSVSTIIIAVLAAIVSLASGSYLNEALLLKNDAVLYQNKASDEWSYYQAKGIKKNIADSFYQQYGGNSFKVQSVQYILDQATIQTKAREYEKQVEDANKSSDRLLNKHHKVAYSVTFFQIAIALSALSALMKQRSFFVISILLALVGVVYMIIGFLA